MPVPTNDAEALARINQGFAFDSGLPYDPDVPASYVAVEQTRLALYEVTQYLMNRDGTTVAAAQATYNAVEGGVDVYAPNSTTLSGLQTLDGVAGAVDLRVLVAEKGVYAMKTGAWVRLTGYTTAASLKAGTLCYVSRGTTRAGTLYLQTTAIANLTDAQVWVLVGKLNLAAPSSEEEQLDFTLTPGATVFTLPLPYLTRVKKVYFPSFMQGGPLKRSQWNYDPETAELELLLGDYPVTADDYVTVYYLRGPEPAQTLLPAGATFAPHAVNNAGVLTITDVSGTYKIPARKV